MKKRYVVGFLFSEEGGHVAVVNKQKLGWQKNKWNGIGGKIEENESALQAMQREFKEEAGLDISNWTPFCVLSGNDEAYNNGGSDYEVHFFSHFSDEVFKVQTMEAERIGVIPCRRLLINDMCIIPNLKWLIPMALERGLLAKVFDGIKMSV